MISENERHFTAREIFAQLNKTLPAKYAKHTKIRDKFILIFASFSVCTRANNFLSYLIKKPSSQYKSKKMIIVLIMPPPNFQAPNPANAPLSKLII